jgi:hypothetical protein
MSLRVAHVTRRYVRIWDSGGPSSKCVFVVTKVPYALRP